MLLLSEEFHNKRDLTELNKFGFLVCEKLQSDLRIEKMGKVISVILLSVVVFSCKKDKIPEPCQGISMSGERSFYVGTWHWYSTTVEKWFDIGPSIYHDYTPNTQGYEYHIVISPDGVFKGYKNNSLVTERILSDVHFEYFNGISGHSIQLNMDCQDDLLGFSNALTLSNDSINTYRFPLDFDDQENHLKSLRNFFVRE